MTILTAMVSPGEFLSTLLNEGPAVILPRTDDRPSPLQTFLTHWSAHYNYP
jgi:hypothetical protein